MTTAYDPNQVYVDEDDKKVEERVAVAPPLQLMWWKFRKHKLALISAVWVILIYLIAIFCEFVAPYTSDDTFIKYKLAYPTQIHIRDAQGNFRMPFVYKIVQTKDLETLRSIYTEDTSTTYPITFFTKGPTYKMWGLWESNIHLFGLAVDVDEQGVFVFGADRLGRDLFSRVIYGSRISLSIGLIGVFMSLTLGIMIGGISGYYGGQIDTFIQRVIEFIRSIPQIPLWMALSAALPGKLARALGLLWHHHHPLVGELDRSGAGCSRPVPGAARRGLRDGGPSIRFEGDTHYSGSHGAFFLELYYRKPDPLYPEHDPQRNRA